MLGRSYRGNFASQHILQATSTESEGGESGGEQEADTAPISVVVEGVPLSRDELTAYRLSMGYACSADIPLSSPSGLVVQDAEIPRPIPGGRAVAVSCRRPTLRDTSRAYLPFLTREKWHSQSPPRKGSRPR